MSPARISAAASGAPGEHMTNTWSMAKLKAGFTAPAHAPGEHHEVGSELGGRLALLIGEGLQPRNELFIGKAFRGGKTIVLHARL